ncbi:cystinosin homolog [Cotesia glomerata]|uniref:cystinosin homolog n=1 Tax=Cotesia glomerata TaxID=32391 RepID=UPI001D0049D2|nr:cystinosin homolog [Cotesia glomerata]
MIFSLFFFIQVLHYASAGFKVDTQDLRFLVGEEKSFDLYLTEKLPSEATVILSSTQAGLVKIRPSVFNITKNDQNLHWNISVTALSPGYFVISTNVTPDITDISSAFVVVTIEKSLFVFYLSDVVGWIYFLTWTISFYPQVYENYKRKSVVGFSFDFLALNIVGFVMYALFNCGLYWIPEIERQYSERYPRSLIPVLFNDVFFSINAVAANLLIIWQCFIYEIGSQRVSITAKTINGIFGILAVVSLALSIAKVTLWLDFFYLCSYIKLVITIIKYIPQTYSNCVRKSTSGWSIATTLLDITGGILSMLQMILNSYNYNDWESIYGDITKFGLGLISTVLDAVLIFQHYVLYRYEPQLIKSHSFIDVLT